jgi:hypothetical protein
MIYLLAPETIDALNEKYGKNSIGEFHIREASEGMSIFSNGTFGELKDGYYITKKIYGDVDSDSYEQFFARIDNEEFAILKKLQDLFRRPRPVYSYLGSIEDNTDNEELKYVEFGLC